MSFPPNSLSYIDSRAANLRVSWGCDFFSASKSIGALALFLVFFGLSEPATSATPNLFGAPTIKLTPPEDPLGLPYRFHIAHDIPGRSGDRVRFSRAYVPYLIEPPSVHGLVNICNDWIDGDNQTALIFHGDISMGKILSHDNRPARQIDAYRVGNFDSDPMEELAVTYVKNDSVWLTIVDPTQQAVDSQVIMIGVDRDGNGFWDGIAYIVGLRDVTGDGVPEVFVATDVGYDLYDRVLLAIDIRTDSILWQFQYAGSPDRELQFVERSDPDSTLIIFGASSKGNHVTPRNGMDDSHSYTFAITLDGRAAWVHRCGAVFTNCFPEVIQYDTDPEPEILCAYRVQDSSLDAEPGRFGTRIEILDVRGDVIESLAFAPDTSLRNVGLFDVVGDSASELVFTFADHEMIVCNQQLQPIQKIVTRAEADVVTTGRMINPGERSTLLTSYDGNTYLLNDRFEVEAWLDKTASQLYTRVLAEPGSPNTQLVIGTSRGERSLFANVVRNPWTSVFFRKPWLASLVVFLPMALVMVLVTTAGFRIRRKNRVIEGQRQELAATLHELRATQAKLVAAEKYRTAQDIAGSFAHEIRNALLPVELAHVRLHDKLAADQKAVASLTNADRAVNRALELTSLISQYVKADQIVAPEPVDLHGVVREVRKDLEERIARLHLTLREPAETGRAAWFNREAARMVVSNLVTNAVDALEGREGGVIAISLDDDGAEIVLRVGDNGPGIAPEVQGRLFDPFVSTKPRDSHGLGLALVRRLVEQYGGSIRVENRAPDGALFEVRLPAVEHASS